MVTLEWVDQHIYNIQKAACQSTTSLKQQTSAASYVHFIDDQIFFQFLDAKSSETAMMEVIPTFFANSKNAFPGKRTVGVLEAKAGDEFRAKVAVVKKATLLSVKEEEGAPAGKCLAGCEAYLTEGFSNL